MPPAPTPPSPAPQPPGPQTVHTGVSFNRENALGCQWVARIWNGRKKVCQKVTLGRCATADEAARIYDAGVRKHRPAGSPVNIPLGAHETQIPRKDPDKARREHEVQIQ